RAGDRRARSDRARRRRHTRRRGRRAAGRAHRGRRRRRRGDGARRRAADHGRGRDHGTGTVVLTLPVDVTGPARRTAAAPWRVTFRARVGRPVAAEPAAGRGRRDGPGGGGRGETGARVVAGGLAGGGVEKNTVEPHALGRGGVIADEGPRPAPDRG